MLRKISFIMCIIISVIVLIMEIIGMVNICKLYGFNLERVIAFHFESVNGTVIWYVATGLLCVAYLLLLIDYCIETLIPLKILMILSHITPIVVFVLYVFNMKFRGLGNGILGVLLIALLIAGILFILSHEHRYKLLCLIVSGAWTVFGISVIVFAFAVVIMILVIPLIVGIISGGRKEPKEFYDAYGNKVLEFWE